MARASVTETMDSCWGSDFHRNSFCLLDADADDSSSILMILISF